MKSITRQVSKLHQFQRNYQKLYQQKNIFYFSQQQSDSNQTKTWIKEVFQSKFNVFNDGKSDQERELQSDIKNEINYYQLAKQINDVQADDKQVQLHLVEIYQDIKKVVNDSYENKTLHQLMKTVPSSDLCHFAVEQFIGSMTQPKNEQVMNIVINYAEKNAKTEQEQLEVEYYRIYLNRLSSIQSGQKEEFDKTSERLTDLSQKGFPLAQHIIGKELYKVALNATQGKYKKQKKAMLNQSAALFQQASQGDAYNSFYYLGDMAQTGDLPGGIDLQYAYECFLIAASFDNPQAYFKLAKFHKEGLIAEKDTNLQFFYTKKAAELGVVESQHNLACMYLEGTIVQKNQLKALAWFTQASASDFVHSQFNLAKMYMEGSEDGLIKVNYKAALIYLQKIEKSGAINVEKVMNECLEKLTIQEQEKEEKQKQNEKQKQKDSNN